MVWRTYLSAGLCALLVSACSGTGAFVQPAGSTAPPSSPPPASIKHVVVIVQENRTFNDLFAGFPGAVSTMTGKMVVGAGKNERVETIPLKATDLNYVGTDPNHFHAGFLQAYHGGRMDGFAQIRYPGTTVTEGIAPYQYVKRDEIRPYWTMATEYALADEMFQTQGSASFTAHQDLIRGGTAIDSSSSLIDVPTGGPWGCDAETLTVTDLITTSLEYEPDAGPFPCLSYPTLQTLLDAHSVSWKYYVPAVNTDLGGDYWNAFLAISSVYHNHAEWKAHISSPNTNIFRDVAHHALPAMSWVIPDAVNSDHPSFGGDTGPSWVASVVNAIGESAYWPSTAIFVVWDDWGGFYDPVKPPKQDDQGGPGFRVPMIVISPYVPRNELTHTVYEFGSIVRFVEDTFGLGRLGTTDRTATSVSGVLNLVQPPRRFVAIRSKYDRGFFLRQRPSGLPLDDE